MCPSPAVWVIHGRGGEHKCDAPSPNSGQPRQNSRRSAPVRPNPCIFLGIGVTSLQHHRARCDPPPIRAATLSDVDRLLELEAAAFGSDRLSSAELSPAFVRRLGSLPGDRGGTGIVLGYALILFRSGSRGGAALFARRRCRPSRPRASPRRCSPTPSALPAAAAATASGSRSATTIRVRSGSTSGAASPSTDASSTTTMPTAPPRAATRSASTAPPAAGLPSRTTGHGRLGHPRRRREGLSERRHAAQGHHHQGLPGADQPVPAAAGRRSSTCPARSPTRAAATTARCSPRPAATASSPRSRRWSTSAPRQLYAQALPELDDALAKALAAGHGDKTVPARLLVFFGTVEDRRFDRFGRLLFDWFRCPVLEVTSRTATARRSSGSPRFRSPS